MSSVMLAIHEKKPDPTDVYKPIRSYISHTYSEREAQNLESDLQALREIRSDLVSKQDQSSSRRDLFHSYYRILCVMETRFPISSDPDHINTLIFRWHDSFKPKHKSEQPNIHLEKASILFNLAALHTQLALTHDRSSVDGIKQASHAFIAAAGTFAFLKDNEVAKVGPATVDLSAECVGMLEKLMLAQAQECVFESTIAKNSTPSVCAKIARQVGLYYEEAFALLNVALLDRHFDKSWISHVQLKAALFYAEACYRYSLDLHQKEEIAEEIARLKSGISALSEVKKSSKSAAAQILDAISKLESNLNRNLEIAMKENDRVYLMRVPPPGSLPPILAFSLVKSMPMNDILDASKEKLFSTLVPDNSAKSLSRYTEKVDDIIRVQAEKLQQGSELARVRLKDMDLPDSILALEGNFSLPEDLKDDVEAVQISGGPADLDVELQQVRDLKRVNQELLVQTEELLQKETIEDSHFRNRFGARWTRTQSSPLTKNLQDRLNRFAANMKQAAESDLRIERSVKDHSALMSILDCRPIESALPNLSRPIISLDANEDSIVGGLKQSLRQLETLGAQRAGLEDMLKEMKRKDDILPKLMTSSGSSEDLFRKELSKYDHICGEITQNIESQECLLQQIQAQNDEFSVIFNLEDYKVSREKSYKQIQAAIEKFKMIKDNINEGLKFYVTLQDAISNVKQQCSDFVMTRSMQCREMSEDVERQMTGLSFHNSKENTNAFNSYTCGFEPNNNPNIRPQTQPYYQPHDQAYGHAGPPYSSPQHLYGTPYPPPHATQDVHAGQSSQPTQPNHDYGQPPYPGWRGPYYNGPLQPGAMPRPPYPYPPGQTGYYRPQ